MSCVRWSEHAHGVRGKTWGWRRGFPRMRYRRRRPDLSGSLFWGYYTRYRHLRRSLWDGSTVKFLLDRKKSCSSLSYEETSSSNSEKKRRPWGANGTQRSAGHSRGDAVETAAHHLPPGTARGQRTEAGRAAANSLLARPLRPFPSLASRRAAGAGTRPAAALNPPNAAGRRRLGRAPPCPRGLAGLSPPHSLARRRQRAESSHSASTTSYMRGAMFPLLTFLRPAPDPVPAPGQTVAPISPFPPRAPFRSRFAQAPCRPAAAAGPSRCSPVPGGGCRSFSAAGRQRRQPPPGVGAGAGGSQGISGFAVAAAAAAEVNSSAAAAGGRRPRKGCWRARRRGCEATPARNSGRKRGWSMTGSPGRSWSRIPGSGVASRWSARRRRRRRWRLEAAASAAEAATRSVPTRGCRSRAAAEEEGKPPRRSRPRSGDGGWGSPGSAGC